MRVSGTPEHLHAEVRAGASDRGFGDRQSSDETLGGGSTMSQLRELHYRMYALEVRIFYSRGINILHVGTRQNFKLLEATASSQMSKRGPICVNVHGNESVSTTTDVLRTTKRHVFL
jgi:hypothetical protein